MSSEQLTIPEALQVARQAGFSAVAAPFIVAIALAETGGTLLTHPQDNVNLDPSLQGTPYYGSRDRGILQINNVAHPEVSDSCAYDPVCAFKAAFQISNGGTNFSAWATTHVNPSTGQPYYAPYLAQTQAAANGLPFSDVAPQNGVTTTDLPGGRLNPLNGLSDVPIIGNNWWKNQLSNAASGFGQAAVKDVFGAFGGFLSDFWDSIKKPFENAAERVGLVILGGILVLIGAFVVFAGSNTGKQTIRDSAKAMAMA